MKKKTAGIKKGFSQKNSSQALNKTKPLLRGALGAGTMYAVAALMIIAFGATMMIGNVVPLTSKSPKGGQPVNIISAKPEKEKSNLQLFTFLGVTYTPTPIPTSPPPEPKQGREGNIYAPATPTPEFGGGGNNWGNGGIVAEGPQCTGAEAPDLAKSKGLTKLAFCEDFSDPSRINLDGSLNAGQTFTQVTQGNIFGADKMPASAFSFSDGVMSVKPTRNNYQVNMISAVPTGGGQAKGFLLHGSGWYSEIRWKHPACQNNNGFPAFWSMDAGHLYGNKIGFLEPDFYEYIGKRYIGALHNWNSGGDKAASVSTQKDMPVDPSQYFIAGSMAEPGNTAYSWHLNGQLMGRQSPSWVSMFSHFSGPVMFGSGPNCPYDVDFVRIWTAP